VADPLGDLLGLLDDPAALGLRGLRQPALPDEERGLLLGAADDACRLVLGLLEDALTLGVDPLGGPDFLWDRDAQLVDEIEDRVPIDEDLPRRGQARARRDLRLEPLEEKDDVRRRPRGYGSGWPNYGTRGGLSERNRVRRAPSPRRPESSS
jgi:hypothetical protein